MSASVSKAGQESITSQRIDKWLWHARFARTRGLAQRLALSGHVRINRDKVHLASRTVRAGDVLTIAQSNDVRIVRVVEITDRRGSYEEARHLYREVSMPDRSEPECATVIE